MLDTLSIQVEKLVAKGLERYTQNGKNKLTNEKRQKISVILVKLLLEVFNRIRDNEEVSIFPLKALITELVFFTDFNKEVLPEIVNNVYFEIFSLIKSEKRYDLNLIKILEIYKKDTINISVNPSLLGVSDCTELLQQISEYQYSNTISSISVKQIDNNKKVYTLFPPERYWEVFNKTLEDQSYSPIGYNRFANKEGFSQYAIPFSYKDLIIKDGKLYKVKSNITLPNKQKFEEEEWNEFQPKKFDKSKSFKKVLSDRVGYLYERFLSDSFDINSITSDSNIEQYPTTSKIDEEELINTFGGEGKKIYRAIKDLKEVSNAFGGFEGSVIGGIEYVSQYTEYLLLSTFGRRTFDSASNSVVDGELFGKFDKIFSSKKDKDSLPGLSFLSTYSNLKSFVHRQVVPDHVPTPQSQSILEYNPVSSLFFNGIDDFYSSEVLQNSYSEPPKVDLLLYTLESMYKKMIQIGDGIKSVLDSIDEQGRAKGYEGLGSVIVQMKHFQAVFPPSTYLNQQTDKLGVGLTSVIKYLLNNYAKLSETLIYVQFPGEPLKFFLDWMHLLENKLEQVISIFKTIGINTKSFIPNISFKNYQPNQDGLVGYLSSLGFRDSEINTLLEVSSFKDLIERFAPLSDSADLKSFFKAYELSQLIYEFAGDEGISAYLSFLYSSNSIDTLLNILDLVQKNPSKITSLQVSKYPKLVGLLIGLTYAIDPTQLIKFNKVLRGNNLSLLQSIKFLYQSGEKTIIKREEEVQLIRPIIEQIISGFYNDPGVSPSLDYEQANSETPIALKQWTKVISDNLGNLVTPTDIQYLYDKAVGLTPRELITILNSPNSLNSFSEMIDGFEGGEFAKFIRYANLSGLAIKLNSYKNSYQVNNFKVDIDFNYLGVSSLVTSLDGLLNLVHLNNTIFENSLVFKTIQPKITESMIDGLISVQNKSYDSFAKIFEQIKLNPLDLKSINGETLREVKNAPIVESPGIGNSRLPNRIPAINTISPEQAKVLITTTTPPSGTISNPGAFSSILGNKFIKFGEFNQLVNSIEITEESIKNKTNTFPLDRKAVSEYEILDRTEKIKPLEYKLPMVYNIIPLDSEIKSQTLGVNYLKKSSPQYIKPFSPIESCKRFGGETCEELYQNSPGRCVEGPNKSLFPEDYSVIPGSSQNRVYIDRPLGTFAEYKPSSKFIPTSSFSSPPNYFALLPKNTIPGDRGEPIISGQIGKEPLVFSTGNGTTNQYGNTEFALIEFIKAKLEKSTEFECASFDSPFQYQICMNLMKCKRFTPSTTGKYWLDFCPKTLIGGRLRP